MIKLLIDTSNREKTSVSLQIDEKSFTKEHSSVIHTSQMLLSMIVDLLRENKLKISDLAEIEVNVGPGSFTGLRVGVSIANTLSYSLNIPVNGRYFKNGPLVEPVYF